jgi:hypothetical protein
LAFSRFRFRLAAPLAIASSRRVARSRVAAVVAFVSPRRALFYQNPTFEH